MGYWHYICPSEELVFEPHGDLSALLEFCVFIELAPLDIFKYLNYSLIELFYLLTVDTFSLKLIHYWLFKHSLK